MRSTIAEWWAYGQRTRWTVRDYARHFGYVSAGVFVAMCGLMVAFQ